MRWLWQFHPKEKEVPQRKQPMRVKIFFCDIANPPFTYCASHFAGANQSIDQFLRQCGTNRESYNAGIERLHTALEVVHFEVNIWQKINLVDNQRIHAAIHAGIFVRLSSPSGIDAIETGLMCAEAKISGTHQIADVFHDQQIKLGKIKRSSAPAT